MITDISSLNYSFSSKKYHKIHLYHIRKIIIAVSLQLLFLIIFGVTAIIALNNDQQIIYTVFEILTIMLITSLIVCIVIYMLKFKNSLINGSN